MSDFLVPFAAGLLLLVVLVATGWGAASPYRHVLLGVTLPKEAEQHAEVTAIVHRYKRGLLLLGGLSPLALLPLYAVRDYASLHMVYMLAWFTLVLLLHDRLTRRASRRLRSLKEAQGWLADTPSAVVVDTAVSRRKAAMPLSPLWFVPALAISLAPALVAAYAGGEAAPVLTGPGVILLLFLLRHGFITRRLPAYCRDTAVNLACARIEQRGWSICFTACAYAAALCGAAVCLLPYAWPRAAAIAPFCMGAVILGFVLALLITFLVVHSRVERLLDTVQEHLYLDEDRCWRGPFYYNPRDPRIRVEKRYGVGFTYNLATRGGKAVCIGLGIVLAAALAVGFGPLLALDASGIRLSVTDGEVAIDAPVYGTRFPAAHITDLTEIDALPSGTRTNGIAAGRYRVGHFRLDGIGDCLVYADTRQPPFLVIHLGGEIILLNGPTPAETARYRALLEAERESAARAPGRTAEG